MELIKSTIKLSVQWWFEAHWLFPLTFCERKKSNNNGGKHAMIAQSNGNAGTKAVQFILS